MSLKSGEFLDCWKQSFIIPIHKSGSKSNVDNYRPIDKLQLIPKIFEAVVKRKLYAAVRNHISECQHGFVSGRSTSTNLVIFTNYCLLNMEKRLQVDCIYTDFSKAFDRVNHNVLVKKLEMLGFHSSLLRWLTSYLFNRKQHVKIGPMLSREIHNFSGVPQGSHLGPLLFLLFINDLPHFISTSKCLLYADDVKIFRSVKSVSDAMDLQNDINRLSEWCYLNGLYFNIDKCSVISFKRIKSPVAYEYRIQNSLLKRASNQKDLGVVFDDELSFSLHFDYVICKANRMLGFLFRNSKDFQDPYTLKSLYISLIRSVLEYCCVVWSPYYCNTESRIEKIQKRFTKFALRKMLWNSDMPTYEARCALIDLKPLNKRRIYYSVLFAHDVLTAHIDCSLLLSMFNVYAPSRSLRPRHENFFYVSRHSTNYGQNDPITTACVHYNEFENLINFNMNRMSCKSAILNSV